MKKRFLSIALCLCMALCLMPAAVLAADGGDDLETTSADDFMNPWPVIAPAQGAHGEISLSPEDAAAGDEVTITVTPDKGFLLETLKVSDTDGKAVELTAQGGGIFTFTMPDGEITVNVTFMDDNTMLNFCTDVSAADYYYDAVLWAYRNEIASGTDAVSFSPNGVTSRAMAVTFLWKLAGQPYVNYALRFDDVAQDAWYAEAVRWAASEKIVSGTGESTFSPNDCVTREQLATMIYKYEQSKGGGFQGAWMFPLSYEDAAGVSACADEAMHWVCMKKIVSGKDGNLLDPQGTALRCETVTMLYRYAML